MRIVLTRHHQVVYHTESYSAQLRIFPIYVRWKLYSKVKYIQNPRTTSLSVTEKLEYLRHYNPWNCSNTQWEGNHKGLDGKKQSDWNLLDRTRVHDTNTHSTLCERNLTTRPTSDGIPIMLYKSESSETMPWYQWRKRRGGRRRYQEAVLKWLRKNFSSRIAYSLIWHSKRYWKRKLNENKWMQHHQPRRKMQLQQGADLESFQMRIPAKSFRLLILFIAIFSLVHYQI